MHNTNPNIVLRVVLLCDYIINHVFIHYFILLIYHSDHNFGFIKDFEIFHSSSNSFLTSGLFTTFLFLAQSNNVSYGLPSLPPIAECNVLSLK